MHATRFSVRLWLWRRLILVSALTASAVALVATGHIEVGIAVAFAALAYVVTRMVVAAIRRRK